MQTVLKTRAERVPTRGAGELPLLKAVKGGTFIGIGTFVGINLSSRNISVAFDNSLGCRERASCGSTPPMAYCSDHGLKSEVVADWTQRTRLRIEGMIVDVNTV